MKIFNPFMVEVERKPWFWSGVTLGILVGLIFWWILRDKSKKDASIPRKVELIVLSDQEPEEKEITPKPDENDSKEKDERATQKETPDNLKRIEGIGPRSAQVLEEAGVTTFEQLSGMDPDSIQGILREAGVRVPYPDTWPEQAALAAVGKWDELGRLQDTLQGGRRV